MREASRLTPQLRVPCAVNEPTLTYSPGSPERAALKAELQRQSAERLDIPLFIGGREIRTGRTGEARMPHAHQHVLATYHQADAALVGQAIDAALAAKRAWAELPFHQRAAIFLRAADLLATKYRARLNAATMLNQSKTAFQAEIDSACELADFLRFNVAFAEQILQDQPLSSALTWNQMDYRPLDGFVFAASPFNFTAIAGNLPSAPALMGNTVVWKPSDKSTYSNWHVLQLFREAGLPDGVINMVQGDAAMIAGQVLAHPELGGVHFTGSTSVFQGMWRTVGENITRYRQYPRLVGETGGKDFVFAHPSAKDDLDALAVALVRGAYEFQGQKCSAASRAFIPASLWPELRDRTVALIGSIRMGDVRDFRNFMSAVIDERSFKRLTGYLEAARNDTEVKVLAGGEGDS
ncbi:MAG: aldehyde dehydrogenase family protein, partial [Myxococcales bacterium]